jgi:pyruvate dehydrogenase (quinone)
MNTVADRLSDALAGPGLKRIGGIACDNLHRLADRRHRPGRIGSMHVRHGEVAPFGAGAEANLTGEAVVWARSGGPGNPHLIDGLFDCHRLRVAVAAIAARIASAEVGAGSLRKTHLQTLVTECSRCCELGRVNESSSTAPASISGADGSGRWTLRHRA